MKNDHRLTRHLAPILAALLVASSARPALAQPIDPVREWHLYAAQLVTAASAGLAPVQQSRAMAIVQVSVHDAINSITAEFETYRPEPSASPQSTPEAAAIGAAYQALFHLLGPSAALDAKRDQSLALHQISPADMGVDHGMLVADQVWQERQLDHADAAQFDYTAPGAGLPGVWVRLGTPPAPALLPGWGGVTPFVLRAGSQFRPDAPPALDSELYARDFNEVVTIGRLTGSSRTEEQRQIAFFWRASPVAIWSSVTEQVLAARQLDLSEEARALGLAYLAAADTSIALWDAKYIYNFWRPFPAILGGDVDDNTETVADPTFRPLLATPPHPEYPSAHTGNSNAIASTLEWLFGDEPGIPLTVTLPDSPSGLVTRTWYRFDEAVDEVIDARVFSGIHFRNSDEVGARLGKQVARFVFTHALRPCVASGCRR